MKRIRVLIVLAACLFLQSCFTTLLWRQPADRETRLEDRELPARIALTPLALILDLLTLPLQECWCDDDEGHDDGR